MTKLLVTPNHINDIETLNDIGVDGYIIGVKEFSNFNNTEITMQEFQKIVPIIKKQEKEVFASLNKVIYNEDIPLLKEYLLILDQLGLNGIMYDDISVVNLAKTVELVTPLIWMSSHSATNYYTCNYWLNHGVYGAVLANEITLDEIKEIKNNTQMKLMVNVYGYLPMSQSSRSLVSNYFEFINEEKESNMYKIYEKERKESYPIYEDEKGTYILSSHILNALDELPVLFENKIEYIILNSLFIERNTFVKICEIFREATKQINSEDAIKELSKRVVALSGTKTDKGFLYKETVYRVKSND